jgi:succinate dehydrogenase/fumarate reductase-like Fe-S protein
MTVPSLDPRAEIARLTDSKPPSTMTTAAHDVIVLGPDQLLKVCAWCLSAKRLAELHLVYRCSDGICPSCSAAIEVA